MSGYELRELFEGIDAREFVKAIEQSIQNATRLTASQICTFSGDGSVTQERINQAHAAMLEFKPVLAFDVLHGRTKEYPQFEDYLYIIYGKQEGSICK